MADVSTGGRIVPIVTPRQHYSNIPPEEPSVQQTTQQPPAQLQQPLKPSKNTRNTKNAEAEILEIPCLNELGLYALPTEGDGNCLYNALSDQIYGDFLHAEQIRVRLADHISANRDYFMSFIAAVGGERRAPRRAAASATKYASCSSSSASPAPLSDKELERSFESKVAESRRTGVWGGAEEIQAFCQAFKWDVNVYTMYGIQNFRDVHAPVDEERELAHIAFHDFHHYSSVRYRKGPQTGPPCIPKVSQMREEAQKENLPPTGGAVVDMATPWKISAIQEGLGGKYDRDTIVEVLQQCRGNIDRAFINLLGENTNPPQGESAASRAIMKSRIQPSSRSSSPFSTGSKRSADESDSEENPRPALRRTRAREHKRRILPDVTVGIAFRDDQNDLVSLRLRVSPDTVAEKTTTPKSEETKHEQVGSINADKTTSLNNTIPTTKSESASESSSQPESSQQSESNSEQKPRRSRRIARRRHSLGAS